MLDWIKKTIQVPRTITARASNDRVVSSKSEKPDVAAILMSKNRKERRQFKKQHGIFLHGSTKPIVNVPVGKQKAIA
jgi:hypothetical protein